MMLVVTLTVLLAGQLFLARQGRRAGGAAANPIGLPTA